MGFYVGQLVIAKWQPLYWDPFENENNPEDYDEDELEDIDEHPGFNDEMYQMLGKEFEVIELHDTKPWIKLRNQYGEEWWWHTNWIEKQAIIITYSDADKSSKYLKVITKVKQMQARRLNHGHKF